MSDNDEGNILDDLLLLGANGVVFNKAVARIMLTTACSQALVEREMDDINLLQLTEAKWEEIHARAAKVADSVLATWEELNSELSKDADG